MNVRDPKFTARLEEALRLLAKQPTRPLAYITSRFDLESGSMQLWLAEFNGGQKQLTVERIEQVKRELGSLVTTKAAPRAPAPAAAKAEQSTPAIAPSVKPPIAPTTDIGRWLEAQKVKIVGRVNCFQVEVTPELAAAWLTFNQGNRNPSKAKIRRFAAAMAAGKWSLNGETVKFSVTGRLLDGQSRLMAIVLAGVPVVLEVRAGLPDIAQQSMDSGELRKGVHTLEMLGEKYPMVLAPALRLCFMLDADNLSGGGTKSGKARVMENQDVMPALERHALLKRSVGWVHTDGAKIIRLMPASAAAFFHYVFGVVDGELRDHFFAGLADGIGLTKQSPVYHLREFLLERRQKQGRGAQRLTNQHVIKAWNATLDGEKISVLTVAKGELFPVISGWKKAAA